jgi:DNA-binding response OmpR family regulator
MPHKDGLAALCELQKREDTKHIPIVMLSASLIDQQRALDAGAAFFMTKPYAHAKLIAAVKAALRDPHATINTDKTN